MPSLSKYFRPNLKVSRGTITYNGTQSAGVVALNGLLGSMRAVRDAL
jgi:hypothetical protein